jgi:hypothetical protein
MHFAQGCSNVGCAYWRMVRAFRIPDLAAVHDANEKPKRLYKLPLHSTSDVEWCWRAFRSVPSIATRELMNGLALTPPWSRALKIKRRWTFANNS